MADAVQARDRGDLERTVNLLREAYAVQPAPEILNNMGRVYEMMGRYRDAVASYKRVVNDEEAAPSLRGLDAGRMAALQPKLALAWIRPALSPEGTRLLVDGRAPDVDPESGEFPVAKGEHVFEVRSANGRTVRLVVESFPLGRASPLAVDLGGVAEDLAVVTVDKTEPAVSGLVLNDYELRADPGHLGLLLVSPGPYALRFVLADQTRKQAVLTFEAGTTRTLSELVAGAQLVQVATPASIRESETSTATALRVTAGPPPGDDSSMMLPLMTAGAGLLGVGVGAGLMILANSDQADIQDAATPEDGAPLSIGITEAEAYDQREDAESRSTLGKIVLGVGGAVALGGVVWWLMGDSDDTSRDTGAAPEATLYWGGETVGILGRF